MKLKGLVASLLAGLAIAGSAQATIVDHGDYLTDTATGLDWLDVTKSVNMSYDQVSAQFGSGGMFAGWGYASGSQYLKLVENYTSIPMVELGVEYSLPNKTDGLIQLLGSTLDSFYLSQFNQTYSEYYASSSDGQSAHQTDGILADVPNYKHLTATLWDIDDKFGTPLYDVSYTIDEVMPGRASPFLGSFLVRPTASSVPEPTPIALLGVGLLGLLATRRKTIKA